MFPRPDTVSVVGCGPSALKCGAANAPGMVIAVNGSVDHVRYDVAFTMDGRFAIKRWQSLRGRQWFVRRSAWEHARDAGAVKWDGVHVFDCDVTRTQFGAYDEPTQQWTLNGSNSGYCALNLAYALRPRRVFLYGFDMDEPTHFFGQYPWHGQGSTNTRQKFDKWAREMVDASHQFRAARIEVYNTNPNSNIKAFPHGRPNA